MAHSVHTAAICTVACSPCSPSSLLAVTGPRCSSVGRAHPALRYRSITTSCSAASAEVCGSYVHSSRFHWGCQGRLVLDYQRMVWLAPRKTVPQLCQAWFKCPSRRATENRQSVAAVTESTIERSSRCCEVVFHTLILSPAIGTTFVLTTLGISSGNQAEKYDIKNNKYC